MSNSDILPLIDAELSTMPDAAQKLLQLARDRIVRLEAALAEANDEADVNNQAAHKLLAERTELRAEIVRLRTPPSERGLAELVANLQSLAGNSFPRGASKTPHLLTSASDALLAQAALLGEARGLLSGVKGEMVAIADGPSWLALDSGANRDWIKQRDALLTKLDAAT